MGIQFPFSEVLETLLKEALGRVAHTYSGVREVPHIGPNA